MSGFAQSYYRLGIIREDKNDLAGAMESYRKSLDLDPSNAAAHLNLGILLSRRREYEPARVQLQEALRLDPGYARAYYNLGLVYSEEAVNDSALLMMDKALEIKEDYSLAKLGKASIYYEMARLDAAESLLVSLRDDPSTAEQSRKQIDGLLNALPQRRAWVRTRQTAREKLSDQYLLRGDNMMAIGLLYPGDPGG
jgi:superkiller protein 3